MVEAIATGDGDLAALRAQAYAEHAIIPVVNQHVRDATLHKLLQTYSGHARKNHQKLAAQFNAAAKAFTAAAGIVDPNTDATTMVDAPEDQRQAWLNAPILGAQLDSIKPALAAAAALGGVDTRRDEMVLPLVVDVAGVHRRALWQAWASTGRAGRWPAIIACGAAIHADPIDQISPYRRPRPIEHVRESRDGYVTTRVRDPEDVDVPAAS